MAPGSFRSQIGLRTGLAALWTDKTLATMFQVNADHLLFQMKVHRVDLPGVIQT
jgi:hypothetical protein